MQVQPLNVPEKMQIRVTLKAAEKIRHFMTDSAHADQYLHFALVQTHCMGGKGFAYRLGFEPRLLVGQKVFEDNDVHFAVDDLSARRLNGTTIDYVETIENQGFVINNPNAIATCPCGHHDIFES